MSFIWKPVKDLDIKGERRRKRNMTQLDPYLTLCETAMYLTQHSILIAIRVLTNGSIQVHSYQGMDLLRLVEQLLLPS